MLELRRVNASYGESHILRDVSMTVEPGEVVVVTFVSRPSLQICVKHGLVTVTTS